MKYVCTTCDQEFAVIPEDTVQLTPGERRVNSYRFIDGSMHSLRRVIGKKTPKPEPQPEPPLEQTELLQEVVEVLEEFPQPEPVVEEVKPVAAETDVEESMTTMVAAFRRSR